MKVEKGEKVEIKVEIKKRYNFWILFQEDMTKCYKGGK
jgi:hypothetical protein